MALKEIEEDLKTTSIPTALTDLKNNIVLIVPKGQFDMQGAHHMQNAFNKVLELGYTNVILDMQGVSYAASMGIGAVVSLIAALGKKKGKLAMMNIHPKVLDVFSLLGFTQFLNIADSLDEALKEF